MVFVSEEPGPHDDQKGQPLEMLQGSLRLAPSGSSSSIHGNDFNLFRIDSEGDSDLDDLDLRSLSNNLSANYSERNGLQRDCEQDDTSSNSHHDLSHDLFMTPVDVDFAEATIVAPVDLPEGSILRVYMGRHRILVVEVPPGGIEAGSKFEAPYRIHHSTPSPLELFRIESYKNGQYHGWMANLLGCCEFGPLHPSFFEAFCCPCVLLSKIMGKLHLNWCGKYEFPTSPTIQEKDRRCATFCIVLTYLLTIILNFILIWHIATMLYKSQRAHLKASDSEEYLLFNDSNNGKSEEYLDRNEQSSSSVSCGGLLSGSNFGCEYYTINIPMVIFIVTIDVILCSYILFLFTRTRSAVRDRHFIQGGIAHDCCISCLCHCCVLSQLARESYECEGVKEIALGDGFLQDGTCVKEMDHLNGFRSSHGQKQPDDAIELV